MRIAAALAAIVITGCAQTPTELKSSTQARVFASAAPVADAARCIADAAEEFQSAPLFAPLGATIRDAAGGKPAEVHVRASSVDPLYALASIEPAQRGATVRLHTWQPWVRAAEFEGYIAERCAGGQPHAAALSGSRPNTSGRNW